MIETKHLSWHKDFKVLSEEVSTLGGLYPIFKKAIPDTILVKSSHTGKVIKFKDREIVRSVEGEILYWRYKNDENDVEVHLIND